MICVTCLFPKQHQAVVPFNQFTKRGPRLIQRVNVGIPHETRLVEDMNQIVSLNIIFNQQGDNIRRSIDHVLFKIGQPRNGAHTSVNAWTDGSTSASMAESYTVWIGVGGVRVMRIEHEGANACLPLSIQARSMIARWIIDTVLVSCKSVVRFGKRHVVVRAVTQDCQTVANQSIIGLLNGFSGRFQIRRGTACQHQAEHDDQDGLSRAHAFACSPRTINAMVAQGLFLQACNEVCLLS